MVEPKRIYDMNDVLLQMVVPIDTHKGSIPFADCGIPAGFPNPAQDYSDYIDLNQELVRHPETTFYARVAGRSMEDAGIGDGDIVVVDRSLEARSGDKVAAYVDGGFTIKEFRVDETGNCAWLVPANPKFRPVRITDADDFAIWGVITYVIKKMR